MLVTPFGIVIEVSPEQLENAEFPMLVTFSGMEMAVTSSSPTNRRRVPARLELILFVDQAEGSTILMRVSVSCEQSAKAPEPMFRTLPGIAIRARPEQPLKALLPMLVTVSGIVAEASSSMPEKAESPMTVTKKPSNDNGIERAVWP